MFPNLQLRATIIGFLAVVLWAALALLTTRARGIPPFQLLALSFSIAGVAGIVLVFLRGEPIGWILRRPAAWIVGVGGLFGYHAFYFIALANAPAVEASLIAYLWPLLIVLLSALLPGERLGGHHVLGAVLGFGGAALLITGGRGLTLETAYLLGYGAAAAGALTWSSYSVINRRFRDVPSIAVAGYCLATAALGFAVHLATESWVAPDAGQWGAIVALGLGPVGLAFFAWDYGTKHGHLQLLGSLAYAAPLLSTLLLIAAGEAPASVRVLGSAVLIVGGAAVAAGVVGLRKTRSREIV